MASSCGHAVGTWVSLSPCRASGGAATSTTSGSGTAVEDLDEEALRELKVLAFDGWDVQAVSQVQEPLRSGDIVRAHGFVVVRLLHTESSEMKFVRLDWGVNGLSIQIQNSDEDFICYAQQAADTAAHNAGEAATTARTGMKMGVAATMVSGLAIKVAAEAEFTGLIATASVVPFVGGAGVLVVSLLLAGGALACWGVATLGRRTVDFEYTPAQGEAPLRKMIRAIETVKHKPYDVCFWNCNHFATHITEILTVTIVEPVESSEASSSQLKRWSPFKRLA